MRAKLPRDGFAMVWSDRVFTAVGWLLGCLGLALPLSIVGFLALRGLDAVSLDFLLEPPEGFPMGSGGGIGPAIQGSLALISIALAVSLPLAVGAAVYLVEYGRSPRLLAALRFAMECMASIPAMVYGLLGYAFLVVFMALKVSLLAGGVTLGLMMFPVILIGAQESMRAGDPGLRESALALGVSQSYVVRRIILVKALPGILAVTALAGGHAFGSAAPVLYTASVIFSHGGLDLSAPVMTLPTHLYYLVGQAISDEHAYGTALVLVLGLLAANSLALLLKSLSRR